MIRLIQTGQKGQGAKTVWIFNHCCEKKVHPVQGNRMKSKGRSSSQNGEQEVVIPACSFTPDHPHGHEFCCCFGLCRSGSLKTVSS